MKKALAVLLVCAITLAGCGNSEPVTGIGDTSVRIAPITGYTEAESEAIRQELAARLVYKPSEDHSTVQIWLDEVGADNAYLGTLIFSREFEEKNYEFAGLETGKYIEPLERDGRHWLNVTVKALFSQENNVFTYNDSALELMIPITIDDKGKVTLGKYYAKTYLASSANPQEDYLELGWNKKIINLQTADVTHDGVQDYIQTVIWVMPEVTTEIPSEMLTDAGVGYVEVYDGSTAGPGDLGVKIWEEEFAAASPGNTQVSLVHKGGLDYLLLTDINQQFGTYYFQYQVQSLDRAGREYIIEDQTVSFDTFDTQTHEQKPLGEEQKEEIRGFKEQLTPWFERAILLVATDGSNLEQYVSTPEQTYSPEQYYDTVWTLFLD